MHRAALVASLLALGACASTPPGGTGFDAATDQAAPHAIRAPAPPRMPAMASQPSGANALEAARRLYTVADTVVLRGAALCEGRVRPHPGLRTWSRDSDGPNNAAHRGSEHGVTVFTVARDGPAARAGLQPGDRITSIDGAAIPAAPGAMSVYGEKLDAALARTGPVAFGYQRAGQASVANVVPVPACDIRVVFANSPMINAATDGRSVMVMRGLVNLLARDDELALVVGHELSHSVLGHFARGRALGHDNPFGGRPAASLREFEREADYVGLYFVALSGYDYEAAIESATRMAMIAPMGDRASPTHPSQAVRYAVLVRAAREIRAKLAQGAPLRPNIPTGRAAANTPSEN